LMILLGFVVIELILKKFKIALHLGKWYNYA
jgi:hypothetical protein